MLLALMVILSWPGPVAETPNGFEAMKAAAERGDVEAQLQVGAACQFGLHAPKDAAQALRWYRRAAEQGDVRAHAALGSMHATGEDTPRDCAEAVRWLTLAAEEHHGPAQLQLGRLHLEGCGVPVNPAVAAAWFDRAAELMEAGAQQALGHLYYAGHGVARNEAEAVAWFRRATRGWVPVRPIQVAVEYDADLPRSASALPKDDALAYFWASIALDDAATAGSARLLCDRLERRLRPEAKAAAGRLLAEWRRRTEERLDDWVYRLGHYARDVEAEERVKAAGPEAVPTLLAVLKTASSPLLVRGIGHVLSDLKPLPAAVPSALEHELSSRPPSSARLFVAVSLSHIDRGNARAIAELERGVREGKPRSLSRVECASALAGLGDARHVPTFLRLLEDEDPHARAAAARGLRQAPAAVARGPLEARLRDTDAEVRRQAAVSLLDIVPDAPEPALERLLEGVCAGTDDDAAQLAYVLANRPAIAARAESALRALLVSPDAACRARAAVVMADTIPGRAADHIEPLRRALASESGFFRLIAAQTLADIGTAARVALPDLKRAAAADPALTGALARLEAPPTRFDQCSVVDLRLVAVLPGGGESAPRAFVSCRNDRIWEVAPGARFYDGRIDAVDAASVSVSAVMDTVQPPAGRTLALFDGTARTPLAPDPRFKAPPLHIDFAGDVSTFASLLGLAFGMNVIVEAGTEATVRVSARDTPWDAAVDHALRAAGLGYRIDQGTLMRLARGERVDMLPPLSAAAPSEEPVSIHIHRADIRDVMRLFQDVLGVTIALPPGPHEPLTLYVTDVPADQLFDLVVASRGWTHRREGHHITIEAAKPPRG